MPILELDMLHTQGGPAQQVLFCINQHRDLFKHRCNSFKKSDQKKANVVVTTLDTAWLLCCMKFKCVQLSVTLKVSQQLFRTREGYPPPLSKVEETCSLIVVFFSNVHFMISSKHSLAHENW